MIRSTGFVIANMVTGFLSGMYLPHVFGIRGAILGGTLAGGVLACDACRKKKGELPVTVVLAVAVIVSLVAFLLIRVWDAVLLSDKTFAIVPQITWHSALTCFLISLGVLFYYKTGSLLVFFWISLLSVIPRAIALEPGMRSGELPMGVLVISIFCGVAGLLPFLLLWLCAAWLCGLSPQKNR